MRLAADIARAGIGPGPAFVVGGAGGLAGLVALAALEVETAVVAAGRSIEVSTALLRGSTTPAPRTPDTQQLSCTRAGTLFFSQHTALLAISVG